MTNHGRREEEKSLELALRQPWVRNVSDFIFLAPTYEDGWLVLSLADSSSLRQCAVGVLIIGIAEPAKERRWRQTLETIYCPIGDFNTPISQLIVQDANLSTTVQLNASITSEHLCTAG